jgi:hypothetical protein
MLRWSKNQHSSTQVTVNALDRSIKKFLTHKPALKRETFWCNKLVDAGLCVGSSDLIRGGK